MMDYNCAKQAAYSIKKTTKKALLSQSMSTWKAEWLTTNCAKQVAKHRKDYKKASSKFMSSYKQDGLQMCQADSL